MKILIVSLHRNEFDALVMRHNGVDYLIINAALSPERQREIIEEIIPAEELLTAAA